jgi:hypothetical protein
MFGETAWGNQNAYRTTKSGALAPEGVKCRLRVGYLGVRNVVSPAKQTLGLPPSRRAPTSVPKVRETANRQRRQDQHPQPRIRLRSTHIDRTAGARIWAGNGVLNHNLVKITALASPPDPRRPDSGRTTVTDACGFRSK